MNQVPSPNWWQGLLASLYGGFTEEIMLRLFGMTFIVWLLAWITKKEKDNIPNSFYYVAIFLVAIIFGLGHLPATIQVFGDLSTIIVIRALVLNGLLGLWFGYLYWRKGLEYAMIAHMSADIFLHVLFASILY
ncbi:CPBP family intramembrane glutamic endopeptidase [Lysinibacillus sp. fls2-241-R2A-57]|nr:CPBP family intramembrane glutamic endopeptidase [Lysinibacillus sp. fls2-241-R2A-57]